METTEEKKLLLTKDYGWGWGGNTSGHFDMAFEFPLLSSLVAVIKSVSVLFHPESET